MKPALKITILSLVFTIFLIPLSSSAQIPSSIDGVTIVTYPQIPAPGEQVVVSLESYSTDLNGASIIWIVDGKNNSQGIGRKSITLPAPKLGKQTTVVAVIMTVEKREVRKLAVIKSGSVDLIWESEGYVPPLYKGKALFGYENVIKVRAIPNLADSSGAIMDPKTLLYKWTRNDKVVQDQSGYGKQTLTFSEEIPREQTIIVEVSTPTGTAKATSRITLSPGNPSVAFYEESPLYGVLYNKAITNDVKLTNSEVTIRAVPYTFNFDKPTLSFIWSINGLERTDLAEKESITLRTKADTEGSSIISLRIKNRSNILQGAQGEVGVRFSKKQVSNNFTF